MFSGSKVSGDIVSFIERNNRLPQATVLPQNEDEIHKQIAAFERLLQHAMSRFSKDNLYQVLCHVSVWAEKEEQPTQPQTKKSTFKLRSITQLRDIFDRMSNAHKTNNNSTAEDDHIIKHYELFLNDLYYLRDLKKYFDDEIYNSLKKYRWVSVNNRASVSDSHGRTKGGSKETMKIDDVDSGHGSPSDQDDNKRYTDRNGNRRKSSIQEHSPRNGSEMRYKHAVDELNQILRKWDGLLSEDVLDLNDFDPDSYHELMQYSSYTHFEPILRLVPDIFAKCYKCIDLAKTWLEESNAVVEDIPEEHRESPAETMENKPKQIPGKKDYSRQMKNIQMQIESLEISIEEDQEALQKHHSDMAVLVNRNNRLNHVTSDYNKMDSMITIASGDYQKSKTEQYAVANKIRNCSKGSQAYSNLKSHLKRLDSQVAENHWRMKLLEYERDTFQEDYLVEMEVRPSFIRFTGDTKDKIQDLEKGLEVKMKEKLKLEKQLQLLKTNAEQTRSAMMAKLGNESTETSNNSRNSTIEIKLSDLDGGMRSEPHPDNGNEADVDSPVPFPDNTGDVRTTFSTDGAILQKPKLVHKYKHKQRIVVPVVSDSSRYSSMSDHRETKTHNAGRGPRAALKTTPRRVWENL